MGKKKGRDSWAFVGGFVDVTDKCFEETAVRELSEEIEGIQTSDIFYYICTSKIDDSRYPKKDETLHTVFYATDYISGTAKPNRHEGIKEFVDVAWLDIDESVLKYVHDNHRGLFIELIKWMEV